MCQRSIPNLSDERFVYYFLSHVPDLGAVSIKKIIDKYPDLNEIFELNEDEITDSCGLSEKQKEGLKLAYSLTDEIYYSYEQLSEQEIRMIIYKDKDYPERLLNISSFPIVLYVKGKLPPDSSPSVAIVGSRSATNYGLSMTDYFSYELARNGISIISGMAAGIDGAAHAGALKAEGGNTFAVLGCGVNICYPKENYSLYCSMAKERGGIISEIVPGLNPLSRNFPMRNRIISGLADAVLIMEGREKSGSLITADLALDQGREVFALPGRITDPMSRGCNRLISMGAGILISPENILEALKIKADKKITMCKKTVNSLAKEEKIVYSTLDLSAKHIEQIVDESKLPYSVVINALLNLELQGYITQISSNYYGVL